MGINGEAGLPMAISEAMRAMWLADLSHAFTAFIVIPLGSAGA